MKFGKLWILEYRDRRYEWFIEKQPNDLPGITAIDCDHQDLVGIYTYFLMATLKCASFDTHADPYE